MRWLLESALCKPLKFQHITFCTRCHIGIHQKRKEKTLDALLAQLKGLAAGQPVLMVWEDVHWSDPTP
jgi:hypothetical protein